MVHLRVLTLNVWSPPQGKHIPERMNAIADKLIELSPDIICLQETFLANSRDILSKKLQKIWSHQHYFSAGFLGTGLMTFSKFPIIDSHFLRFSLGGKPEKIKHGDYYVAKGIGLARIQTPHGIVDVYNTHPHAQYENTPDNEYAVYTNTSLYEAVRFTHAQSPNYPIIFCGDFNTQPHELGYSIVTQLGQFADPFMHLHPNTTSITFSDKNPYVTSESQRLDYIFLKGNIAPDSVVITFTDVPHQTEQPTIANQEQALAYSDHYGVMAELVLTDSPISPSSTLEPLNAVITRLHKQISQEYALASAQKASHTEQAWLGLGLLADSVFTLRAFSKQVPLIGKPLRATLLIAGILYSAYHALNSLFNLTARLATLKRLQAELNQQIHAKRLFDGRAL